MKIDIRITRGSESTGNGTVLTLRYARDPQIIDILAPEPTVKDDPVNHPGNFSHLSYYSERGQFGDVHNTVNLGRIGGEWEQYLFTINPADAWNKMINPDYDTTGKARKVMWYTEGNLVFGNMVPGSVSNFNYKNRVRVKTNADGTLKTTRISVKFPAWVSGRTEACDFVEVDGFRKIDKGRPVSDLLAEGRMGWFTEISTSWNVYRALGGFPALLCPYWTQEDFPPKYGKSWLPLAYFEGYGLRL